MNNYETKHVLPTVDDSQHILSLSLQQFATAPNGDVVEGIWYRDYSPASAENIQVLCDAMIADLKINEFLDAILVRKATPVMQVDPMTPKAVTPLTEAQERAAYVKEVDDSIAQIITSKTRFQMGYIEREAAATAFLAPANVQPPSDWITRFADNTGMPYIQAAQLVLSQAAQLRAALKALDNLRMDKYLITKAATIGEARNVYTRICFDRNHIAESLG
jgi:hypothetical protein